MRRTGGTRGVGLARAAGLVAVAGLIGALLALAPVAPTTPAAADDVNGSSSSSSAPEVCTEDVLKAPDGSTGGSSSSPGGFGRRYGHIWVPPGGQLTVTINGTWSNNQNAGISYEVGFLSPASGNNDGFSLDSAPVGDPKPFGVSHSWKNVSTNNAKVTFYGEVSNLAFTQWVNWTVGAAVSDAAGRLFDECGNPAPDERSDGCAQPKRGDPVNVVTGAFYETWTDLAIDGRGPGLLATRTYDSANASRDVGLGYGWSHSYGMSLTVEADGRVAVRDETGAVARFRPWKRWTSATTSVDDFLPVHTSPDRLAASGTGWTYTRAGRELFHFDSSGRLTSISDLNGHATTLTYATGGTLNRVTDSSGRALVYTWSGSRIAKWVGPRQARRILASVETLGFASGADVFAKGCDG